MPDTMNDLPLFAPAAPRAAAPRRAPDVAPNAKVRVERAPRPPRPARTAYLGGTVPSVRTATSEAAAARVEPKRPSQRQRVLAFVAGRGGAGATRPEIAATTGLSENTVRPRVCELLADAQIVESRVAAPRGGCAVLVTPAAEAALRDAADAARRVERADRWPADATLADVVHTDEHAVPGAGGER